MTAPSPLPVLLTRSRPDNARLARRLRREGIPVLAWTTIRTRVLKPAEPAALVAALAAAEVLAFTSRRGLLATRALLGRKLAGLLGPPRRVAVVGEATAELAARLRCRPAWVGSAGGAALARTLASDLPPGTRVVLLRAEEADDVPERSLREAGLIVDDFRVYRQEAPPPPPCAPRALGAVVCASPSAARRVIGWHDWVLRAPFVAIGETTAAALREAGATEVHLARRPDPQALCDAVLEILSSRGAR